MLVSSAQYCIPTYTNQNGDDYIDGFELNNVINNNTGNSGGDGYIDYSQSLPQIELVMGSQYDLFYTGGLYDSDKYRVWIDYNHDNDFDDANEAVASGTTSLPYQTIQLQFIVPEGILEGVTRLRIRCAYALTSLIDPCDNYTWGETEDYAVNITPSGIYCTPNDPGLNGTQGMLASALTFGSISSTFYFPSAPYYHDYTSNESTSATVGGTISGQFECGSIVGATTMMWIDWNQDAIFSPAESVYSITSSSLFELDNFTVNVPLTALTGSTRIRVRVQSNGLEMDPCISSGIGYGEDYTLNLTGGVGVPPSASFSANSLTINAGGSVNFTDMSSGSPTSWAWTFTGGSPASSSSQNPSGINYNAPGCYTVSLTCSNGNGSDSQTETCFINVVEQQGGCTELFFSEYLEGAGNDKAIELYNPNAVDIDLAEYSIELYANGATTPNNTLDLVGILGAHSTTVISNSSASASMLGVADQTSAVCNFNGDDALTLSKNGVPIDVIGIVGVDPGSFWPVGTGSTSDHTLVRNASVNGPSADWTAAQNQWTSYASGSLMYLANHSSNCESGTSNIAGMKDENTQPLFWCSDDGRTLNWRNIQTDFIKHATSLYDMNGSIIHQFRLNSETSTEVLPVLAVGFYLVRIEMGASSFSQKVVLHATE